MARLEFRGRLAPKRGAVFLRLWLPKLATLRRIHEGDNVFLIRLGPQIIEGVGGVIALDDIDKPLWKTAHWVH